MKKQYWDYIPFGLAMIHLTTAETAHLKDSEDYHIKFHERLFENTYQFVPAIMSEELVMFTPERLPYDEGFMKDFLKAIEDGKEDNYFGVLVSFVAYEGLRNTLINKGFSVTDHKVQSIGHIFSVMNDPNSKVFPEHATNDVLYNTIKGFPIKEEDKKLNTHERREMALLEFLKKQYDYAVTDGCKDMRESDWPDRHSLWMKLGKSNPKDFKQDATKDLVDKFFNKQQYVSYSDNKKTN
ncbi:hypothetical protein OS175_07110 [Marinicella sp. S1101]|nr:hypothetical protein [Marinicella marina]MCX7553643.1 hypothetical protein [Marinicella marina]